MLLRRGADAVRLDRLLCRCHSHVCQCLVDLLHALTVPGAARGKLARRSAAGDAADMAHPFAFSKVGRFHKAEGNTIFGWAFVSTIKGVPYFDLGDGTHSDHIPTDSIMPVSKSFMRDSAVGLHQHDGAPVAEVLYAYPVLDDIMIGNSMSSEKQGLIIGWDTDDPDLASRALKGEDTGFSIGGVVNAWDIVDGDGNVIESISLEKASRFGATLSTFGKLAGDVSKEQLRRVFRSWALKEISLVDFPMQEPALVGVVKGKYGARPTQTPRILKTRRAFDKSTSSLTSVDEGHQHVVDTSCCDASGTGRTSYESVSGDDYGHDHAFVRAPDGSVTIAMNEGHAHTVDVSPTTSAVGARVVSMARAGNLPTGKRAPSVNSQQEPTTMNGQQQPNGNEVESLKSAHAALKEQLTKAQRFGLLSDAHKAYHNALPELDRDAFAAKSTHDREVEIKAAQDRDPVRYTSKAGKVYRESQAELADMAKERDEAVAAREVEANKAADASFSKVAIEKMAHFSKKADLHAKMIKALAKGLEKADYEAALEVIAAADAVMAPSFEAEGSDGVEGDDPADAPNADGTATEPATVSTKSGGKGNAAALRKQLDDMAVKHASENKIDKTIAKARLLKSNPAARKLYDAIQVADKRERRTN
jgi:hypothetical protein